MVVEDAAVVVVVRGKPSAWIIGQCMMLIGCVVVMDVMADMVDVTMDIPAAILDMVAEVMATLDMVVAGAVGMVVVTVGGKLAFRW